MDDQENQKKKQQKDRGKRDEHELPEYWRRVQAAIWLLGIALLAWMDWWWPGILVLVAFSGLVQAGLQWGVARQEDERAAATQARVQVEQTQADEQKRGAWLPATCPQCGAPLGVSQVRWNGPESAECPYCNAHLKPDSISRV